MFPSLLTNPTGSSETPWYVPHRPQDFLATMSGILTWTRLRASHATIIPKSVLSNYNLDNRYENTKIWFVLFYILFLYLFLFSYLFDLFYIFDIFVFIWLILLILIHVHWIYFTHLICLNCFICFIHNLVISFQTADIHHLDVSFRKHFFITFIYQFTSFRRHWYNNNYKQSVCKNTPVFGCCE